MAAVSLNSTDIPYINSCLPVNLFLILSVFCPINLFIILLKFVQKPSYISSIKPVPVVVCKFSVYNSSLGARNECVHFSVNHTICKDSVIHFGECAVNVHCKVFKIALSSLSVRTVSVSPVNVVKYTTTSTYQYTNLASKLAVVH